MSNKDNKEWRERLAKYLKGTEYSIWYGDKWDLSDEVADFIQSLLDKEREKALSSLVNNTTDDLMIRLVRAYTNETMLELSKRVGLTGQSHISRLEAGKKRLSVVRKEWFKKELLNKFKASLNG